MKKRTKVLRITSIFACAIGSVLRADIPETDINLNENGWVDASQLNRLSAFDQLAYAISESYPLSELKAINWDDVYDHTRPRIVEALNNNDLGNYFRLIREFALTATDGHVSVISNKYAAYPFQISYPIDLINGSYGFTVVRLENGSRIVHTQENGAAEASGLISGMQVLSVDGIPVREFVERQPVSWLNLGIAHTDTKQYFKGIRSGLGTSGETRIVEVVQSDSGENMVFEVIARDYQDPWLPGVSKLLEEATQAVTYEIIEDENLGYLRIHGMITQKIIETREESDLLEFIEDVNSAMSLAVQAFDENNVDNLIVDLRGNLGGLDRIGAEILGYFISESQVYSTLIPYDFEEGEWNIDNVEQEIAHPKLSRPFNRIVVLADFTTLSAAEGLLYELQKLPNCRFVGYWGSNGSYSETGGVALLPDEIVVQWPINPKLDADGDIKIDTGADQIATLIPDVRIQRTVTDTVSIMSDDDESLFEWITLTLRDPLFGFFPGSYEDENGIIHSPQYGEIKRWDQDPQVIHQKDLAWVKMLGRGGNTQLFHREDWGECVSSPDIFPYIYSEKLGFGKVDNGVFYPMLESE